MPTSRGGCPRLAFCLHGIRHGQQYPMEVPNTNRCTNSTSSGSISFAASITTPYYKAATRSACACAGSIFIGGSNQQRVLDVLFMLLAVATAVRVHGVETPAGKAEHTAVLATTDLIFPLRFRLATLSMLPVPAPHLRASCIRPNTTREIRNVYAQDIADVFFVL